MDLWGYTCMEKQPLYTDSDSDTETPTGFFSGAFSCFSRKPDPIGQPQPSDWDPLPIVPQYNVSTSMAPSERLVRLRKLMRSEGIAVYLVPSEDEHQLEETALADKRRDFLSGFTGSAGICVVSLLDNDLNGHAALSTDGRYFLQAEKQLDPNLWRLLKQGAKGYPTWAEYAVQAAQESSVSSVISVDQRLISYATGEHLRRLLEAAKVQFVPKIENLVDKIWVDQPKRLLEPAYEYPVEFSGEHANDKIERVRSEMRRLGGTHMVVSALDEIGWLLNLRSDTDIPYSPFFFAYVILSEEAVLLYVHGQKVEPILQYLSSISGFALRPYEEFYNDVARLEARFVVPEQGACNDALVSLIKNPVFSSIVADLKVIKNPTELSNAQTAQAKDSLVHIIFAAWLEYRLLHEKAPVNEWEAAQKIYSLREKMPNFKGLSYATISSSGANGAVIHYAPSPEEHADIEQSEIYLLDSGAQFLEGTTDITRTYKFGNRNLLPEHKKYYSLVLKGHLAVAMAKFPAGNLNTGTVLDGLSRQPLWSHGLDFNHGTGHGIGAFGNVHEGPLYISTTGGDKSAKDYFKPGGIVTDEPGYYVEGKYGFRVESELEVVDMGDEFGKTRNGENYLGFRCLTKVPFCRKLIDKSLFSPEEVRWINDYHEQIRTEFVPKLKLMGEKRAAAWLVRETKRI